MSREAFPTPSWIVVSGGTNVYAAFEIIAELNAAGESGSVVTMLCDGADRYLDSYYNDAWLQQKGFDLSPYRTRLDNFYAS